METDISSGIVFERFAAVFYEGVFVQKGNIVACYHNLCVCGKGEQQLA